MARKRNTRSKHRRKTVREAARTVSRLKARTRTKPRKRPPSMPRPQKTDPRLEAALRDMNRGRSLTAAAKEFHISRKRLQGFLLRQRLAKRKGQRWVTKDHRLRRVLVISRGRIRKVVVGSYRDASLAGKHYDAAGAFVRTNNINVMGPFIGQSVKGSNGRRYLLETDPNAIHRLAAMDSPPFHEIYEIVSPT
jgi:hypothetical protein